MYMSGCTRYINDGYPSVAYDNYNNPNSRTPRYVATPVCVQEKPKCVQKDTKKEIKREIKKEPKKVTQRPTTYMIHRPNYVGPTLTNTYIVPNPKPKPTNTSGTLPIDVRSYYTNNNREKPTQSTLDKYYAVMDAIKSDIEKDSRYIRIGFNSIEEKSWFQEMTYQFWAKKITDDKFMDATTNRYPHNEFEFDFIRRGIESRR